MPDHVRMLISNPPGYAVSQVIGYFWRSLRLDFRLTRGGDHIKEARRR
jgi:hypothetical protein